MKIAFIGQKGIPAKIGGAEKYVEEVAVRLAERGHSVFCYVRDNYTESNLKEYRGVKLIHLPSIPTKHLDAISHTFLASLHASFQNFDVIHYSMIGPTSLSFIPKIFRRKSAIVSTFQCQDYKHKKWGKAAQKYLQFSEYLTCNVPDRTIVVSRELLAYVREKYGRETRYIPNGVAVNPTSEDSFLRQWGLQKGEYILSASRLIRHKGIHYLIKAFIDLDQKGLTQGKKLVIAGEGFFTDDYVDYLKELASDNKNIIFTGSQTGETLAQLFSHAYIFVQPSENEGLSLALLEAMGYGKAILSSDIPENREAVEGVAVIFRNKDIDDLKDKLLYCLENKSAVLELGRLAKERAESEYSWEKIVTETEEIYQNMVAIKK